jgi:hypothetical protein
MSRRVGSRPHPFRKIKDISPNDGVVFRDLGR